MTTRTTFTTWRLLVLALAAGCAPEALDDGGASALESTAATPVITFGADWSQRVTGTLVAGRPVRIDYAAARLPQCRGETNNLPAWAIGGYFRVNGGAAQGFGVAPASAQTPSPVTITLPNATGTLELWFQVTNRWGCNAWDSNYGRNYAFTVAADPRAPGWVGDGASVISRATCDGGPCDRDRRPLADAWTYETYARQRAAIRVVTFDVWKQGVTDRDNPDIWRQLDVRMYSRFGGAGAFQMRYVSFDRRVGNNARYAVDLRAVDPLPDSPAAATGCPAVPLAPTPDGAYVSTAFEYYFTVNGVEYRPAGGGVFRGVFSNYRTARLEACLPR